MLINNIVSFNYTNTYGKIKEILSGKKTNNRIEYIHGKLRTRDNFRGKKSDKPNNIVLGIKDDEKLSMEYVFFKKTFQRIQKRADINYRNKRYDNVIIVGHSLDATDGDILKDIIIENEEKSIVTIYYYNQDDYERQIINLMAIFGEKFETMYYSKQIRFEELKESSFLQK